MNDDEDSSHGYRVDGDVGAGRGGGDDEITVVIVPRIPRPTISKGGKLLAFGFGELRTSVYQFFEVFDAATAMGAIEMSPEEADEFRGFLRDAKRRINGVLTAIPRAMRPPTTNGTNGESP